MTEAKSNKNMISFLTPYFGSIGIFSLSVATGEAASGLFASEYKTIGAVVSSGVITIVLFVIKNYFSERKQVFEKMDEIVNKMATNYENLLVEIRQDKERAEARAEQYNKIFVEAFTRIDAKERQNIVEQIKL